MESNNPIVGSDEVLPNHVESTAPLAEVPETATSLSSDTPSVVAEQSAPLDDAPESTDAEQGEPASMAVLLDQHQQDEGSQVKKGDLLDGTIVRTSPTEILIDIGLKSEGVISGKELERIDRDTLNRLKVGEQVLVFVLSPEDRNGNVVLSLSRALEEQDWRKAEELQVSKEVYAGKVDGYNKGGLIVRFGRVRGFVPESQVSRDRRKRAEGADPQQKWGTMRGEDISVKVVEVDRSRNRLILSEREALPQMRESKKEKLLEELQVGERKVGSVKSISDFGAFVDVGGADGLVHLTEMSWQHITHPKDVLHVGQEVEVEVISVDPERKRIGLSIKRTQEDPWVVIARKYGVGQLVQGTITKLTKFGAFAKLVDDPEIEGLIHISELSRERVEHPKQVVNEGEVRTLRVVKIDSDDRRIGLSIKRVDSPEYVDDDYKRAMGEDPTPAPRREVPRRSTPEQDIAGFEAMLNKDSDESRRRRDAGKPARGGGAKSSGGGKRGGRGFEEGDEY